MTCPVLISRHVSTGYRIYGRFNDVTERYDLFDSRDCVQQVGTVDTLDEAKTFADHHVERCLLGVD